MKPDIDALLGADLLTVPDDFSRRVMREVYQQPLPKAVSSKREHWQWLALLVASGLGLSQVLGFFFGMWAASADP